MEEKRCFDFTTVTCPCCGKKISYKDYDDCFDMDCDFEIGEVSGRLIAYYVYTCPDCQGDGFTIKAEWKMSPAGMEYL